MGDVPTAILLVGPGGAGKTSLAERIAAHPRWIAVSEDLYWARLKAGRPDGELRTPEEQTLVQARVMDHVLSSLADGSNVVLEFILYEDPPHPLLAYQGALAGAGVPLLIRVLRPSVDEILRRIQSRGRDTHIPPAQLRSAVQYQVRCLNSPHIRRGWVLDTTAMTLEDIYQREFKDLVEG